MKQLFIFLYFIIATAAYGQGQSAAQYRSDFNLKGKPRVVIQTPYTVVMNAGKPQKGQRGGDADAIDNAQLSFSEQGILLTKVSFDEKGKAEEKTVYEIGPEGKLTSKKTYNYDPRFAEVRRLSVWSYNKDGVPIRADAYRFVAGTTEKETNNYKQSALFTGAIEYTCNDSGKVTIEKYLLPDGVNTETTRYSYNTRGLMIAKQSFDEKGALLLTENFEYDSKDRPIEAVTIEGTNGVPVKNTYTYDGNTRETAAFNKNGIVYRVRTEKFDSNQQLTENVLRNRPANSVEETFRYEYLYDAKGNWTRKTAYHDGKPFLIVERTITYF
ncbi:BT_3044 domain-containing protein [Chitinophaga arvensicola]|uniref:YD repeat-containing protein n=1 Tax=Chitinophaga arvensicola TaxID=29529 RepID=A0A1I0RI49_9BACT|nr:DUF4361 domain-containing protein [Chitinophaga arvensicola]SEW40534.1 hypothetical protein SAMN04488122_2865 [Chitinophaga arvensicola]